MNIQELPHAFLDKLIEYLSIYDVMNLSCTCKSFYEIFGSNRVWEPVFMKYFGSPDIDHYRLRQIAGSYREISLNIWEQLKLNATEPGGDEFISEAVLIKIVKDCLSTYFIRNFSENSSRSYFLITENDVEEYDQEGDIKIELNSKVFINRNIENSYGQSNENVIDNDYDNICKKLSVCGATEDRPDGIISKKDLRRRLNALIRRASRFYSLDDGLPGDKTEKYALRYRYPHPAYDEGNTSCEKIKDL